MTIDEYLAGAPEPQRTTLLSLRETLRELLPGAIETISYGMHAFVVRQNRFGQPRDAWQREVLPTPSIAADEVLVYVMASGINFNNVWAALGQPLDVIAERQKMGEPEDFHVCDP